MGLKMFDVVGIDLSCVDLNVVINRYPEAGRGESVRQMSWQGGGKVATGMAACSRLGAKCAMMGRVGDDIFGNFILNDLVLHGVDVSAMKTVKNGESPLSIVMSDIESGSRTIFFNPGNASDYSLADADLTTLRSAKYFFISRGGGATEEAVNIAREAGVKIFIDADGHSDEIVKMLPKIDVFVGSEFFYDKMFNNGDYEKNCREIMEAGPEIVVFTFGDRGCAGVGRDGYFKLPAFKIDTVDTVGAGDVYHGAFLAGLLRGYSAEETARFASGAAAIKCTRIGGRAGIPDIDTLLNFLAGKGIDYTEIDKRVEFYKRGLENV